MRTYITPIGYDTRRVTRPVVNNGLGASDVVLLLRPDDETNTERAEQTIADVEQLLHEIEPEAEVVVEEVPAHEFRNTILTCQEMVSSVSGECVVSLGGGARDILLPLLVAAIVDVRRVDTVLFFSDLNHTVCEWEIPDLTAQAPAKTRPTLYAILNAEEPITLTDLAEAADHSKSTIVRHVAELEGAGLVEAFADGKSKRVAATFTAELLFLGDY